MGFELFFCFLGVPEHVQKTSFFLEWLRAVSGGLGTQFDASGDPKNRSRENHFGCLWGVFWGTRFKTVFSFFFPTVPALSSYRYLQLFKHFSVFRNCRKMREKTHRKNMKNPWKIVGKTRPKLSPPPWHQKKRRFPLVFRSRGRSGTILGSSRGRQISRFSEK